MDRLTLEKLEANLPGDEVIDRVYRAFEGDLRIITRDNRGKETRYTVRWDWDGNPVMFRM